jgi:hypothetical protein
VANKECLDLPDWQMIDEQKNQGDHGAALAFFCLSADLIHSGLHVEFYLKKFAPQHESDTGQKI